MSSRLARRNPVRSLGVLAVAVTALLASATSATGAPGDDQAATAGSAEYVVSFGGSAASATAAVRAAGGTVQDVTAQVGLALVTADSGFADRVRGRGGVQDATPNHAVGVAEPGLPHQFAAERPSAADRARAGGSEATVLARSPGEEPLASLQWDMRMIGATPGAAQRTATGEGVDVGIIDTGIDARHPDLAPNFDAARSRNFTRDIPAIDGPCEYAGCKDPANVDDGGHGTHVAGTVAAADNNFGISGVAPEANLINMRAGQDSGYFFLYETVKALVYAGDIQVDVVNMSFYTDPWLFNCTSRGEYVRGSVTDRELAQQRLVREKVGAAVAYAHRRGVTLVGSAGNDFTNLAKPTRVDETSPDYPPDTAHPRTVKSSCLIMPNEAPQVIMVSSVGPSTTKADYSNYGLGDIELAAPGGWYRDYIGTPRFQTARNMILSSYPVHVAIAEGLADRNGNPVDDFSVKYCSNGRCGFYTYLQGTSMASPHVAGVAAMVVEEKGRATYGGGYALDPAAVRRILTQTATDHACPPGGVEVYTDEGRDPSWNAVCRGTTDYNGLYGEGIVNAVAALR